MTRDHTPAAECDFPRVSTLMAQMNRPEEDGLFVVLLVSGPPLETAPRLSAEAVPAPSMTEFEETLKRLVDRIAKILQAEKCVFMLHDPVAGTLYPTLPAIGIDQSRFAGLERRVTDEGIT